MHAIIAARIAEHFSIQEQTSFLIGGVAPDAVSPKELSHFYTGRAEDYSLDISFDNFINKYKHKCQSPFILGYYTHLIADELWLKGFYKPWLKKQLEMDKTLFHCYHNDFRLLNGKLLEYYGNKNQLKAELKKSVEIMGLDEVKKADVEKLLPEVLGDLEYDEESLKQSLEVFTFKQIVGYIETSVDKGIYHMELLRNR